MTDIVVDRWLTDPVRGWWRYRLGWNRRMRSCGLALRWGEALLVPRLLSVQVEESVDRLRVQMLEGQCPADYESKAPRLAHIFGALECRAGVIGPSTIGVILRHSEPLVDSMSLSRTEFRKEITR